MEERLPGQRLAELVELGDPAALLRAVDGLCASRDWAGLVDLRQRLEEAVERGRPLWPVTTYVEYRMALDGPAPEAASVLRPGAARFALGPLTEVAATTHTFAELAPHLAVPAVAGAVAQERVLRGEDLREVPGAHGEVLELPRRERRILEYLVANRGKRVTKTQIFNAIYGIFDEDVEEDVVESHISKLRKKLRHRLGYDPIDSKRYLGYSLDLV